MLLTIPIALLPVLSKIIKKLIKSGIMTLFSDLNVLFPQQFGFLANRNNAIFLL